MALITYNDKSNYQSSSLADEYKVSANDMNEIKNAINNATTYSTTEQVVGTGIDRKPIYRKVLTSTGLTGTSVQIAHRISNLKRIMKFDMVASNENGTSYPKDNTIFNLKVNKISGTYIDVYVDSALDNNWLIQYILEYTKTTD